MIRTVCSTCGTSYEGWKCPSCYAAERDARLREQADARITERMAEEQEATRRAYHESARRMERASAQAAREHTHAIANSWKLEADAKADRAYDLYRAELYEDAIALARQAFQQDPGNLSAYKTAAWSLEKLGDSEGAKPLYVKQLALLDTPDYRESSMSFATVLAGLPYDKALLDKAKELLNRLLPTWDLDDDTHYLLQQISELQWHKEVASVVARLSVNSSRGDFVPHLLTLRAAGYNNEARLLASNAAAAQPSLRCHMWAVEMAADPPIRELKALANWLASVPAGDRHQVREMFNSMKHSPSDQLSKTTLELVREAIELRRAEWHNDIDATIALQAASQSRDGDSIAAHWKVSLGVTPLVVCWILVIVLGIFLPIALSVVSPSLFNRHLPFWTQPLASLWLFGTPILIVIVRRFMRRRAEMEIYDTFYRKKWATENDEWRRT